MPGSRAVRCRADQTWWRGRAISAKVDSGTQYGTHTREEYAVSVLDDSTPFGATVAQRLADEHVLWLTTIGADGTPQPNPVWFLWQDETFLIYTMPEAKRLHHLARNPRVALNFNSSASGGEVVVFTGTARVGEAVSDATIADYSRKYTQGFVDIKMTEAEFFDTYSVPIHITPDHLRGF